MRAREMAPAGAEFVQTRYSPDANIHTTLVKIIERAGLVPWQKPMQNMRATRETELLAHYPAKDVTSWLGNSPEIANKHYAMDHAGVVDRARREGAKIPGITSTSDRAVPAETPGETNEIDSEKTPLKTPQTVQESGRHEQTEKSSDRENIGKVAVCPTMSLADFVSAARLGLEPRITESESVVLPITLSGRSWAGGRFDQITVQPPFGQGSVGLVTPFSSAPPRPACRLSE